MANKPAYLVYNAYFQLLVAAIFLAWYNFAPDTTQYAHSGGFISVLVTAAACGIFLLLRLRGRDRLRIADKITLLRLPVLLAACLFYLNSGGPLFFCAGILLFLCLDGLDGFIARRQGTTEFGAQLDGETDAIGVFIISLTIAVAQPWFLLAGLWRFLLLASLELFPVKARRQKRRNRARYIFVIFLVLTAVSVFFPEAAGRRLLVIALFLLSLSFMEDFFRLYVRGGLRRFLAGYRRFLTPLFWLVVINTLLHIDLAFTLRTAKVFFKPAAEIVLVHGVLILSFALGRPTGKGTRLAFTVLAVPFFGLLFVDAAGQYFLGENFRILNYLEQLPIFLSDDIFNLYTVGQLLLITGTFIALVSLAAFSINRGLLSWQALFVSRNIRRAVALSYGLLIVCALLWGSFFYKGFGFSLSFFPEKMVSARFIDNFEVLRAGPQFREELRKAGLRQVTPLNGLKNVNVYLFVLEAYGETILDRERFPGFVKTIKRIAGRLEKGGWSTVSGFAESTVVGGGSWMAEGSLACGLHIARAPEMNELLNSRKVKCLAHYFNSTGHETLVSRPMTIRPYPAGKIFGFDKNLYNKDYPWQGPHFGWARLPDQYVLDYTFKEHIKPWLTAGETFFAEFVLVSSHFDWQRLPKYYPDWDFGEAGNRYDESGLAYATDDINRPLRAYRRDYAASIDYVWQSLMGYLDKNVDHDALLIFIGDHQPSRSILTAKKDRRVPVHISSRSPELLEPWLKRKFQNGLLPAENSETIRFADFLPFLVNAYGDGPDTL